MPFLSHRRNLFCSSPGASPTFLLFEGNCIFFFSFTSPLLLKPLQLKADGKLTQTFHPGFQKLPAWCKTPLVIAESSKSHWALYWHDFERLNLFPASFPSSQVTKGEDELPSRESMMLCLGGQGQQGCSDTVSSSRAQGFPELGSSSRVELGPSGAKGRSLPHSRSLSSLRDLAVCQST